MRETLHVCFLSACITVYFILRSSVKRTCSATAEPAGLVSLALADTQTDRHQLSRDHKENCYVHRWKAFHDNTVDQSTNTNQRDNDNM